MVNCEKKLKYLNVVCNFLKGLKWGGKEKYLKKGE